MITLNLKFEDYKDGDRIYSWLKDALVDTFELENAEDIPIKLSKEPNKIISLKVGLPSKEKYSNMVINTSNIIDRDSISDNPEEYSNKEVEEEPIVEEVHDSEESTNIEHVDDINIIKRDRIGDWCVKLAKEYPDKLDKIKDILKNHVTEDTTDKALESASQSILGLLYTIYQNHDDIVNDKLTDSDYSSLLTKFDAIIPLFLLILPDLDFDVNSQEPIDKLFSMSMFKGRYEVIDRDKKVSITSEFEERDIMNNKIKEAFEKRKNTDSYDVEDVEVVGNANDSEEAEYNIDTRELTTNAPES